MFRPTAVVFCLVLSSTEILSTLDIIKNFIDEKDTKIVRVRTVEERDRRWREFAVLDFIGLVEQHAGYTAEEQDVRTRDGYILKLHRISGSPLSPAVFGKPVVYIQHGLVGSSDFLVMYGPQQALAFQLADAGYDVWIGNARGNTYSKRHVAYKSVKLSDEKFWNFSMDEIGEIDVATFVDEILARTGRKKLTYIGYSMGNTVSYILLSARPEYNDKMNLVISIAPPIYFTRPRSEMLATTTALIAPALTGPTRLSGVYQVLPQSKITQIVGKDICASPIGRRICKGFLSGVCNHLNHTLLPLFLSHMPAGGSVNTIDHYQQMIVTGKFQPYEPNRNAILEALDTLTSPQRPPRDYDLSKITSPQLIVYSQADAFVSVKGVQRIVSELKNVVGVIKAPKTFNHLDYMWAFEAREAVYDKILNAMENYSRDD